jgi:hypothetical protein
MASEQQTKDFHYVAIPTRTELVVIPTIIFVIGLVFFVLRIQTRRAKKALGIDDLFLAITVVLGAVVLVGVIVGVHYGVGKHAQSVTGQAHRAYVKAVMIQGRAYSWGISSLKIGLAFQLMRIKGDSKRWRWGLWAMIVAVVMVLIVSEVLFWLSARPISALWDPKKAVHAKFLPLSTGIAWSYTFSSWNLFSDLVFAVSPVFFIRKMNQSLRERVVLAVLMGLGLLCAACAAPRFIALKNFNAPDVTYMEAGIIFWSLLEYYVGVCAVSAPTLRSKFEAGLRALGFKVDRSSAPNSRWYGRSKSSRGWRRHFSSDKSRTLPNTDGPSSKHGEESTDSTALEKGDDTWLADRSGSDDYITKPADSKV